MEIYSLAGNPDKFLYLSPLLSLKHLAMNVPPIEFCCRALTNFGQALQFVPVSQTAAGQSQQLADILCLFSVLT